MKSEIKTVTAERDALKIEAQNVTRQKDEALAQLQTELSKAVSEKEEYIKSKEEEMTKIKSDLEAANKAVETEKAAVRVFPFVRMFYNFKTRFV